jgi:hypothetical protein
MRKRRVCAQLLVHSATPIEVHVVRVERPETAARRGIAVFGTNSKSRRAARFASSSALYEGHRRPNSPPIDVRIFQRILSAWGAP